MGIAECAATAAGTDTEGRGEEGGLSEGAAPGCVREDGAQKSARPTVTRWMNRGGCRACSSPGW